MVSNIKNQETSKEDSNVNISLAEGRYLSNAPPGEEIVISGISGVFPESKNIHEFRDNLMNKVKMVTNSHRWNSKVLGVPDCSGNIPDANLYDAGFFGVHERQATSLDPLNRILQEKTIEAIFDAGLQPSDFENSKTGIYIGACYSESESLWFSTNTDEEYYAFTGEARSMLANRIGYFLKIKGPAFITDTACSSSLYALEHAFRALRAGEIDNAIVGGANLVSIANVSLQFARLGVLSQDGQCKSFDKDGNGYARSEAVGILILQRAKNAKRNYGEIVHVKTNCDGFKENGITYPSGEAQRCLLKDFYDECQISPFTLSYLEAHGTGTSVGDPEECVAADEVLTKGRKSPLLIGSVKSNIGHSEPASGICSIIKCIIGLETGFIPANINFRTPRKEILPIVEGRMKVVTEKTPLETNQGLIGISSFGFGGGNCHVLLRQNSKLKRNHGIPEDDLPRLVCVSGRTRDAVSTLLNELKNNMFDAEHIRLLHGAFSKHVPNHIYRGYTIISKSGEICRLLEYLPRQCKPLYLLFGELNNWFDIGKKLMMLPSFCNSVHKIQKILQTTDINIVNIFHGNIEDNSNYHILGSIVVQICLIDTFNLQEIKPLIRFGYSYGELLSAYVDGVLSLNDTISCAIVLNQINNNINNLNFCVNNGSPQDDGHGKKNGVSYLHNSLKKINMSLKSTDLAVVKKQLLQNLSKILTPPKVSNGNSSKVKYFTAEYLLNILLNPAVCPVDLEDDSLIINIGLTLIENIYENYKVIYLFFPGNSNYIVDLLRVFGSIYLHGYNPQLEKLYPTISFPVSRGTRMISPYMEWNHNREWYLHTAESVHSKQTKPVSIIYNLSTTKEEWAYLDGHIIDGRILFPATGYLFLVWKSLAIIEEAIMEEIEVVFEDCKFLRATNIPSNGFIKFEVIINSHGNFEVSQGDSSVITGNIRRIFTETDNRKVDDNIDLELSLHQKDIYKEFRLRGYNYKKLFRNIQFCDVNASNALIKWNYNWVSFMDNMLQLRILQTDTRLLYVPTYINKLVISAPKHLNWIKEYSEEDTVDIPVYCNPITKVVRCGYIELTGLLANSIARRKDLGIPVLEKYVFIPNYTSLELEESVRVNLQILLENHLTYTVKLIELIDNFTPENSLPLSPIILTVLGDQPVVKPLIKIFSKTPIEIDLPVEQPQQLNNETDNVLIVGSKLMERSQILKEALAGLKDNGFIISRESLDFIPPNVEDRSFTIATVHTTSSETLVLLKKLSKTLNSQIMKLSSNEFSWVEQVQNSIKRNQNDDIILYAENEPTSGILGFVNCLKREPDIPYIRCFFLMDENMKFSVHNPLIKDQLDKQLSINIYNRGVWGTYRHLLLNDTVETRSEHCFVNPLVRGDLSSLRWLQGPITTNMDIPPEKELIYINYSALNFRDVLTTSGKINADVITSKRLEQEFLTGFEFSGRNQSGQRIMGMVTSGALATLVLADSYLIWNVPNHIKMEEAATIPVVYGTVMYSLLIRNNIKCGESILIHSGTGGIGQAAIITALHYGCTVFTTVGTQEKRDFLKQSFPQLKDSNIGNSHDLSFEQLIKRETNGRGVDYVLNALAEEKLLASVRCLARKGTFIEIGKADLASNTELNLMLLQKEAKFEGVMLDQLMTETPDIKSKTSKMIEEGLKTWIKPLNRTIFKQNEVEQAFRYMASGKHTGKVLIEVNKEESKPVVQHFPCSSRFCCDAAKTYVIIGGLGGFGLELADWLILRGARKLVLTSRNGIVTGYQKLRTNLWLSYGVHLHISKADVKTKQDCYQLLMEAESIGEVDLIFNLAVVLEDALFENQTPKSFLTTFGPKAIATCHLDEVSRKLCPHLRNFVIFSSVTCGRGNAGQTNYGMANSVMERICEKRKIDGYPALAIQWGAIGEVGLVAEMQEENIEIEIGGTLQQKIASCMNVLNTFLTQSDSVIVSSMVVAEKKGGMDAASNLVDAVVNILGITDIKTVSMYVTLTELGMDSMTAVEIKQTLEREFEVFLTAKDIRTMTLARLKEIQEGNKNTTVEKSTIKDGFNIFMGFKMKESESDSSEVLRLIKSKDTESRRLPKIIFFPGIEGDAGAFEPTAAELNAHILTLHYPLESSGETVQDVVRSFLPYIRKEVSTSEPFFFIAHSYGCIYALEVAHNLEIEGYSGFIAILDASPTAMKFMLLSIYDRGELQTGLMCGLLNMYLPPKEVSEQEEAIRNCKSWEDKLLLGEELIKSKSILEIDFLKARAKGVYQKLRLLENYCPSYKKLKTPVRLLKAKQTDITELGDDYQLSSCLENPVLVDVVEGNHSTILEKQSTFGVLNAWLLDNDLVTELK